MSKELTHRFLSFTAKGMREPNILLTQSAVSKRDQEKVKAHSLTIASSEVVLAVLGRFRPNACSMVG